jgi:aerobic carbon-monoxide dehydrogenase medium subunit
MLRRFDVHRATSVKEAVQLRGLFGEDAAVYAGGTEILLAMKLGVARWPHLIDVKTIKSLAGISATKDTLRIGATATHWSIERSEIVARVLPALARVEANVANVRVRAAGTLAGNLAFAEPHADPPALLIALGARVILEGTASSRTVPVAEFITGMYETAIAPDEIIVAIEIPLPARDARVAYVKFQILERPSVGVAAVGTVRNRRFVGAPTVVVGAVDEMPRRVDTAQFAGAAAGDAGTLGAIAEAARAAVEPTADLAGSVDYKRHLVGVFAQRAVASLVAQAS